MKLKMKLAFVVIATLCLVSSQALSRANSKGETAAVAITPTFKINALNGKCGHADYNAYMVLRTCGTLNQAERFTFHDDGTIRVNGGCLTALGFIQGAYVKEGPCNNPNRKAIEWDLHITDRQILHPASGLYLSVILSNYQPFFSLQENVFSSFQTFRFDTTKAVSTARIEGMRGLCLLHSNNEVWIGPCGTVPALQKWLIYPDGTIRPPERTAGCLNFDDLKSRTVLIMNCWLAPTTARWVLTDDSALWNERFDVVMDVPEADPSLRRISVHPYNGGENQKWKIIYDR